MDADDQSSCVSEVVSAAFGVVLIRITVLDSRRNALNPQPQGCYQVWRVAGDVCMVNACNSSDEAAGWLLSAESQMFRELPAEEIPAEFLEKGFSANRTNSQGATYECDVKLVSTKKLSKPQKRLKQRRWRCMLAQHPILLAGFELDEDATVEPTAAALPPTKRQLRPR